MRYVLGASHPSTHDLRGPHRAHGGVDGNSLRQQVEGTVETSSLGKT